MNNLETFRDTLDRIETNRKLKKQTKRAVNATFIVEERFCSDKQPHYADSSVSFAESLTLTEAEKLCRQGKKTAVLNFANPVEPGGGVWRGANAQEEYLCRASNLYPCLAGENAASYYEQHQRQLTVSDRRTFLASDRIIYSPGVTVFKTDTQNGQEYTKNWYQVDVITCAAPWFKSKNDLLPLEQLYDLFVWRIKNILEAAVDNQAQALVPGAFGCGAFNNPPVVVSKAFRDVLLTTRYRHAFSDIVFAVKRTGDFCENIESFELMFARFPEELEFSEERNKRRFFQ